MVSLKYAFKRYYMAQLIDSKQILMTGRLSIASDFET